MESDTSAFLPWPGTSAAPAPPADGGLIVMVRPDPAHAARVLAEDLHAELVVGGEATEAALDRLAALELAAPDIDDLAAAMRRAEAIREATREAAAIRISASLNTRLAIHPDTIRRAAAELIEATEALRLAEQRIRHRAAVAVRVQAAVIGGFTAAGVAVAALRSPIVGTVLVAIAVVFAATLLIARRRPPSEPAGGPAGDGLEPLRAAIGVASRRWAQVSGPDADPAQVETLIHRYEPQHRVVADLVAETPAVRAVERAAVQRRAAWVAAWRAETGDRAPLAGRLAEALHREETELWLSTDGEPGPDTLVVAEPYADLPDDRARMLHQRLLALPEGHRVIVVLAPDPDAPSGARLPGIGWVSAVANP